MTLPLLLATQKNNNIQTPTFSDVTMLVHGSSATSGNTNQTFLDSSTNNTTITVTGSVNQGSFNPYGNDWSVYYPGSSYLKYSTGTNMSFGTSDFTVEFWFFMPTQQGSGSTSSVFIDTRSSSTTTAWGIGLNVLTTNAGLLGVFTQGNAVIQGGTPVVGAWNHVAWVRHSSSSSLYLNGVSQSTVSDINNYQASTNTVIGMRYDLSTDSFTGNISNLRVINGTAIYTAKFTPPTKHLATVTNTKLLACSTNGFTDASGVNAAPTVSGTPVVTKFNPFGNEGNYYSTSAYGGSAYFNNNSANYLSAIPGNATAFGTGDFTIEYWMLTQQSLVSNGDILDNRNNSNAPFSSGGDTTGSSSGFGFNAGSTSLVYNGTINLNQWYHIAYVRHSGVATLYINGVVASSAADTYNYGASPNHMLIGQRYATPLLPWYGYFTDFRMVSGTAVYTSAFTPPTSPLTAISGTSFLLGCRNSNLVDVTQNMDFANAGGVTVSTTQSKFNGSSLNFSGTSTGYARAYFNSNVTNFGTGNFTVEAWIYPTSTPNAWYIMDGRTTGNGPFAFFFSNSGNNLSWVMSSGSVQSSGYAVSTNTWTHVAAVRNNGTTTIYANGVSKLSFADTGSYPSSSYVTLGTIGSSPGTEDNFVGYMQELRISSIAQYTANFTPPTAPFVNG